MASLWISPPLVPLPEPTSLRRAVPARPRAVPASPATSRPRTAARAHTSPRPARALPWHFYRRRAMAVLVLGVAALAAWSVVGAFGRAVVQDPATQWGAAPDVAVLVHSAEPGETLWDLAVALGPSGDVRASLDELTRLNGGSELIAGQPVQVPRSWYERSAR